MKANKIELNGEILIDLTSDTVTEADVAEGKTFHKADGTPATGTAGGGANIAYGDNEPKDTTKLWVKTSEPSEVIVTPSTEKAYGECAEVEIASHGSVNSYTGSTGSAVVNGKIYHFGAYSRSKSGFMYDPTKKTQTEIATLPVGARYIGVAAVGENIYLFGGDKSGGYLNTIHVYSVETGTLTTLEQTLPYACGRICAEAVGNKIYLLGGEAASSNKEIVSTQVLRFDTETYEIASCEPLPSETEWTKSSVVGRTIYLFGGDNKNMILRFDSDTEKCTELSETLPTNLYGMPCTEYKGKILLFGGAISYNNSTFSRSILLFDAATEKITIIGTLTINILDAICETVGDEIYILGGRSNTTSSGMRTTGYIAKPFAVILPNNVLQIIPSVDSNLFHVVNTPTFKTEIGVTRIYKGNEEGRGEPVEAALYKDGAWATI